MEVEGSRFCSEQDRSKDYVNGEAIDRALVMQQASGNVYVLQEIVKLFLDECPQRMGEIRASIAKKDAAALRSATHSLHDSVTQFGARHAADVTVKLEMLGESADWNAIEDSFRRLERVIDQLQPAVAALAIDPPSGP